MAKYSKVRNVATALERKPLMELFPSCRAFRVNDRPKTSTFCNGDRKLEFVHWKSGPEFTAKSPPVGRIHDCLSRDADATASVVSQYSQLLLRANVISCKWQKAAYVSWTRYIPRNVSAYFIIQAISQILDALEVEGNV
jgi:hypothetical protein